METEGKKLTTIAENQTKVYEAGKQAEYDRFWDAYQNKGKSAGYALAFAGARWTDDIYNPKYDIVVDYTSNQMYDNSNITDTKVSIDVASGISVQMSGTFGNSNLVTIRKLIVGEHNKFSNTFAWSTKLQNIVFEGVIGQSLDIHWSTLLTADSLLNIVNHLSDSATGKTITLPTTAESTFNAKNDEGAWSAFVATKTNWTFAYA